MRVCVLYPARSMDSTMHIYYAYSRVDSYIMHIRTVTIVLTITTVECIIYTHI